MQHDRQHVVLVVRWPTGGIRTYLKYVYSRVIGSGWRVTCIAPDSEGLNLLRGDLEGDAFHVVSLPENPASLDIIATLRNTLRADRTDIVHSHGLTAAVLSAPVVRFARVPHLVTLHDIFHGNQFSGPKGVLAKWLISGSLLLADEIHTVTYDARQNLRTALPALRLLKESVMVVESGIATEEFLGAVPIDIRSYLGLGDDDFIVGFFGRFMSPKGFRVLVEAMRILKGRSAEGRKIVVVAVGSGGFIREDAALVSRLGLGESFFFLPYMASVAGAIKSCDVIAMPSLWEAAGILAMESMVAGVPLIASSCIGLREVVAGSAATVVPPGDAVALAEAIAGHVSRRESYKRDALRYIDAARTRFDVSRTASAVLDSMGRLTRAH